MFAVIFEVQPKPERWEDYLGLAKQLKPKLEAIDGFIDNERLRASARKAACSRCPPGATRRRWFAGAPRASTTACRRKAVSRYSRTITCGWARSPPTRSRPKA